MSNTEEKTSKEISVVQDKLPVPNDTLSLIKEMALNPNVDADKLEKLTNLHLRLLDRDNEDAYNKSMLELRPKLPFIKKNGSIDYGKGNKPIKYANLDDIIKEIEPIYQSHGFFVEYDKVGDDWIGICKHESGGKVIKHYPAPPDKSGGKSEIQGMGSAFTYAQKGLLKMIFALKFEGEDDDGMGGAIDEAQSVNIKKLLKETGADVKGFLKWIGAANVEEISFKNYRKAVNQLEKKKQQKDAKNANIS